MDKDIIAAGILFGFAVLLSEMIHQDWLLYVGLTMFFGVIFIKLGIIRHKSKKTKK